MNIDNVIDSAASRLAEFEAQTRGVPYERKGVLFSEMLFFVAATAPLRPARIVESGRARGQSTEILARCFPNTEIVSIEFDPNSPDVPVAAERLKPFANVRQLFGDAMVLAQDWVRPGDVVLIDGPKGFRSLRLALTLLRDRRPAAVFLHDVGVSTDERAFLDAHVPHAIYSDAPAFVDRFAVLDRGRSELIDKAVADVVTDKDGTRRGYGYTLGCIAFDAKTPYTRILLQLALAGFVQRMRGSMAKRRSPT